MKDRKYKIKVFAVVFAISFVCFSFYAYQIFFTPNLQFKKGDTYLFIPEGANFQTVSDSLKKNEIVIDYLSFAFISRLLGYQEAVKPGMYRISANMSNLNAVRMLKRGRQEPAKLVFNTIRLKQDLAEKLDNQLSLSKEDILKLLSDSKFVSQYGFDTTTIITMFIPNTYEVYWDIKGKELFDRMKKEYDIFWNAERKSQAKSLGFTPVEITILASIVEAETNKQDERSIISGVYINRLRQGMPLQADPTVKFAVGDFTIKRIYDGHLAIDSPYNTYKYTGLPPGPINLPSTKCIDAVLNTANHKYVYFCASDDLTGHHNFAETYEQHQLNAEKYRRALNKLNIK